MAQWVQPETSEPRLTCPLALAMLDKGVQHSVLAMGSQRSGRRANGSPQIPPSCDKIRV